MLCTNADRAVWAEINLDHFIYNLQTLRQKLDQHIQILAVIKADAYGHGAKKLAPVALEHGADILCVATLKEALEIREVSKDAKILILGYTPMESLAEAIKHNITLCVFQESIAKAISQEARSQNKQAKIHIKLDTGMGRIGYLYTDQSIEEIKRIYQLPHITIEGIFTHFATADEKDPSYTQKQYDIFNQFLQHLPITSECIHCSNSAAAIAHPYASQNAIRAGIVLYGLKPSDALKDFEFKPVMSFKSKIVHIKTLQAGQSISYGRTCILDRTRRIATLPLGYADGYMRLLSNKASVLVRGKRAKVVGTICMDQCMIDVSEIDDVSVGDKVVLFGYDAYGNILYPDELAAHIGTISYEIVCALSKRVRRIYVKGGQVV